ncbi:UNKNOWN [Stylonychia lemnae]|uniref:Cyclin N-terminal domain-containing protein n=1 Tax=Stylonychia lemnae TaxID=5949 RepID=A0A078ALX5_STYLE|nr:UNKNOWN [Stylonychia lemnae]|eukprot:CDW83234.1 UNKNOWN [Stylonychia lemnae]
MINKQGLGEKNRARMIDWMYQVFKAINKSNDKTFFQAVAIMDRCFSELSKKMKNTGGMASSQPTYQVDLHLIGLTCIWISSKLEDVIPISLREIVKDASHFKYSNDEIYV